MIPIGDPYVADYTPPDHLRDFEEERRITRLCMMTSAALPDGLLVRDGALVIPEDASEDLKDRMVRYEGYLRWAAGLPATHWAVGGPVNLPPPEKAHNPGPNDPGLPIRTPVSGSDNTSHPADRLVEAWCSGPGASEGPRTWK
jgi:hypothetical protein